jgi:hypothetical protein
MMLLGKRRGLSLSILCLLTELLILAHAQGDNSNTTSTVAATPAATTTTAATTPSPTAALPQIAFPINIPKFSCSSTGAIDTPGEPVHLTAISTNNGDKTILLSPLTSSSDAASGRMCILSRWSQSQFKQSQGQGHYHPLGRSIPNVNNGEWIKPPGRPARELDYTCGIASNSGSEFDAGEYLCQVTLPWTRIIHADYTSTNIFAPYYMTYYERSLSVRSEISRFLQASTFGPTPQDLDSLEAAHAVIMAEGVSSAKAMEMLQVEWVESQMDPSTFSTGSFSSLRRYWRRRVNARAFEVYRIGESGPAPCEVNSRWRKFVFTNYDVQNARYLRWGDDGVTTQMQQVSSDYILLVLLWLSSDATI